MTEPKQPNRGFIPSVATEVTESPKPKPAEPNHVAPTQSDWLEKDLKIPKHVSHVVLSAVVKDGLPTLYIVAEVRGTVKMAHRHFQGIPLLSAAQSLIDVVAA